MDYSHGTETILLVEDEELLRHIMVDMLGDLGYKVLGAANGKEALAVADGHLGSIDILITDILMPELSGHKLAESLRAIRPAMRVLFISGSEADDGLLAPGTARLQKPFTIKMLSEKIRELLSGKI